jgi:hypothetical protein
MRLKKEIFSRGVRFIHPFEQLLDRQDPLGTQTFEAPWPRRVSDLSAQSSPCLSREYGLHNDRPDSSPVVTPSGRCARSDGPAPDMAMMLGRPVPVGTKRRLGPIKTDK